MRRPQSQKQMQAACDRFNARHAVGDEITVYSGPAQILSGHTAVVYVTGGQGCVARSHIAKAEA